MEKFCHEEEYQNIHYEAIRKYLATHPNYHETSSKLFKLGNIMRVEILTLNFSVKDGLKTVLKTKIKYRWSTIDQGLHCGNNPGLISCQVQGNPQ